MDGCVTFPGVTLLAYKQICLLLLVRTNLAKSGEKFKKKKVSLCGIFKRSLFLNRCPCGDAPGVKLETY